MTKTEQELIRLTLRRYEAMQEKHKLRKEIAVIKRDVAARVALGNLEGINHHWVIPDEVDGVPREQVNWYTTDEMEDLYQDYHGCRSEITNIHSATSYQCKKYIKQTEENKGQINE